MIEFAEGVVTARGCSTKDKLYHVECENHVMGRTSEKFCYCSYFLCNGSEMVLRERFATTIVTLLLVCFVLR